MTIILWVLSLVLTCVATVIVTEPAQYVVARFLGRYFGRAPRGIKGLWIAEYDYLDENDEARHITQLLEFRQFGKYVFAKSLTRDDHSQWLRAKLENSIYLTGTWSNMLEGTTYHGAFQVLVNAKGTILEGKWLGFDSKQRIQHGNWKFSLISHDCGRQEREGAIVRVNQLAVTERN
jgi:hypothetical protein